MTKCDTPKCHRKALVETWANPTPFKDDEKGEAHLCVPCARAYREGHNRNFNEFTFEFLDSADNDDIEQIREVLG